MVWKDGLMQVMDCTAFIPLSSCGHGERIGLIFLYSGLRG